MSKARQRKLYLKLSDFLLDLAKLVFGGIILTGIIDMNIDHALLFLIGGSVTGVLACMGHYVF